MKRLAIYYIHDGYNTKNKKIMGRQAAGEAFLKALFLHSSIEQFDCYTKNKISYQQFKEQKEQYTNKTSHYINLANYSELTNVLYLPDPGIGRHSYYRNRAGLRQYSLCGITHTTASHEVMDLLSHLLIDPVQSWDAIICTSTAVRNTVKTVLEMRADYLRKKLAATQLTLPQFPMIPLGVSTDCNRKIKSADKQKIREKYKIKINETVFLFLGRLSFHAKAHPLQMYHVLNHLSEKNNVVLILAGWFANDAIKDAFYCEAKRLCPKVRLIHIDATNSKEKNEAWGCSDIFISLVDNIQETFGLTPVEAMARGIPVIVTDWNGYKDTVRNGIDGFRIPTKTPPPGICDDLAMRYDLGLDNYDRYCANTSQFVSIDEQACVTACETLINNKSLYNTISENAMAHVRQKYDWKVIIPQYEMLWNELNERRRADACLYDHQYNSFTAASKADPFLLFSSYATEHLSDVHIIRLRSNAFEKLEHNKLSPMINFISEIIDMDDWLMHVVNQLAEIQPCAVVDLLQKFADKDRAHIARTLIWLEKIDVITLTR